jgi:hypothetical protein
MLDVNPASTPRLLILFIEPPVPVYKNVGCGLWIVEDGGRIGSIRAMTKTTELTINLPPHLGEESSGAGGNQDNRQ